jgi:glycosyltransferase involved in cell wall biosynthesis
LLQLRGMNIGIDVSPLKSQNLLAHRVRGTGFYIENLKKSLLKYYPENKYSFFIRGEKILNDIDLVHYPYFEPFFLTLPFFKKQKTVVTVHDLTPLVFKKYFPVGIKGNINWQIQKLAMKSADAIITDSESSRKDIIKYTGISSSKVHTVYLAAGEEFGKFQIPNSKFQMLKEKYNLPEKFVLYVGDVTWNKNLPRLVEAVRKINVTLVMVGSALDQKKIDHSNPWNQDLLRVLGATLDDKRFIRLGFVSTEDLVDIYNLATVFVMPSLYEGFGLPILEAMSCGCPVIVTKEGSIPEIVGDSGYYVDAFNINEIANGIGEVYFNEKLQKELSEKGLKEAKEFNWKKTARNTVAVYKQYCNQ